MAKRGPLRTRRWQAVAITAVVGALALGAAATGWRYARESPPHQGPIVLVAVDGLSSSDVSTPDQAGEFPAIDALAGEGVTFTRAYAHSPHTLPGYTTLLTGRLPFEHDVRDDGGFVLRPEIRTLAELLRNRGFETGGAVSTYLLRRGAGVAQGFVFFDDGMTEGTPDETSVSRSGTATEQTARRWLESQNGQRFFLFLQVPRADANAVVADVVSTLKKQSLYDDATMFVVGGRGAAMDEPTLAEPAMRVAFVVKQPRRVLAGQRVGAVVQLADLAPTILDLVRAPLPGGFYGRSLRPVLDGAEGRLPSRPVYAESLAGYYRLGTAPLYSITTETRQLIRNAKDTIVPVEVRADTRPVRKDAPSADSVPDSVPLDAVLDELVVGRPMARPQPLTLEQEKRLALGGFLAGPAQPTDSSTAPAFGDTGVFDAHRRAARLVGEDKIAEAIQALQKVAQAHPELGAVHWEVGELLLRAGRVDEAVAALERADKAWPNSLAVALALSDALRRGGKLEPAKAFADAAIVRAEQGTPQDRLAAHETAARVALALRDAAAATTHATVSAEVDPASRLPGFVRGRLLFDEGKFEEAVEAFSENEAPASDETPAPPPVAELELYRGESLVHLDRTEDAEAAFRSEILAFPRDPRAYLSLATLYQSTKPEEVEGVLDELIEAVPTPEVYGLVATALTNAGNAKRADAIRADARIRFRGDPSLARILGRGARR
jgi:tetratricopeptide (TPR) repeat protein